MGKSNSKPAEQEAQPCPNCKHPLKLTISRTYECKGCGKQFMASSGPQTVPNSSPQVRSERPSSQEVANKSNSNSNSSSGFVTARKTTLRPRRPDPEIIAIDDTDEEDAVKGHGHAKRKSDAEWPQQAADRVKQAKNNDENNKPADTTSSSSSSSSSSSKQFKDLAKTGNEESCSTSSPTNGKKLDVISSNVCGGGGVRNGESGTNNGHSKSSSSTCLELMFKDWGVRSDDVDVVNAAAKNSNNKPPRADKMNMAIKQMSLSSFTNADPDTHLELADSSGLCIKITEESYQISIMLGSDDLQYCLIGFHDPVYLLLLKVTKKFAELFHEYLNQIGSYTRDETDVRDSRLVILLNMKKPEMAENLNFLQTFFNNFFETNTTSRLGSSGRVFNLNLSKTYEFVQRLFPVSEMFPEIKRFYRKYVNAVVSRTLLKYPSPEHSDVATVTLSDLACLQDGEFLNDNIISFYLKYLQTQVLSLKDQERIHIFNTFFYPRLTQKSNDKNKSEVGLNAAERRHSRVKKWTRNVNIFEKDFLVVPIIKNAHWYLAIICYPYLSEPVFKDKADDKLLLKSRLITDLAANGGNESTTPATQSSSRPKRTPAKAAADVALGEDSFDEADPNQEDLSADLSTLSVEKDKVCCKLPTILIFDSLPSGKHQRVIATLREYIECEFSAKFNKPYGVKMYGSKVVAPTQDNYFDCGIYLLQYVESFFTKPIDDFSFPINLRNWFPRKAIDDKRQQIKSLIFSLQESQSKMEWSSSSSSSSLLKAAAARPNAATSSETTAAAAEANKSSSRLSNTALLKDLSSLQ